MGDAKPGGRFNINPGPPRRTGPRVKEEYVTDTPCEAILKSGLYCMNRAKWRVLTREDDLLLCGLHANAISPKAISQEPLDG